MGQGLLLDRLGLFQPGPVAAAVEDRQAQLGSEIPEPITAVQQGGKLAAAVARRPGQPNGREEGGFGGPDAGVGRYQPPLSAGHVGSALQEFRGQPRFYQGRGRGGGRVCRLDEVTGRLSDQQRQAVLDFAAPLPQRDHFSLGDRHLGFCPAQVQPVAYAMLIAAGHQTQVFPAQLHGFFQQFDFTIQGAQGKIGPGHFPVQNQAEIFHLCRPGGEIGSGGFAEPAQAAPEINFVTEIQGQVQGSGGHGLAEGGKVGWGSAPLGRGLQVQAGQQVGLADPDQGPGLFQAGQGGPQFLIVGGSLLLELVQHRIAVQPPPLSLGQVIGGYGLAPGFIMGGTVAIFNRAGHFRPLVVGAEGAAAGQEQKDEGENHFRHC